MEDIEKKLKEKYKYVMGHFNKKEATLEKEFSRFSKLHAMMVFALALYRNPSLYEHKLFKNVINPYPELNEDKRLSKNLDEFTELRGKKIFMDIYKLCWRIAKDYMDKDGCFKNRIY